MSHEEALKGKTISTGHRAVRPMAPSVFLVRNLSKTLPLVGVIMLAVLLISGIVALMNSIPHSIRTIYSYSRHFVAITPRGDPNMPPKIVERLRTESPVPIERVILCRATGLDVKSIVGKWPFANIGLNAEDRDYYIQKMGITRIDGRLPKANAPEVLITEPVARNLRLKLGDNLQSPTTPDAYSPKEVKIVGIGYSNEWVVIGDYNYQRANHFPPVDGVLAFAKDRNDQEKLDRWALKAFTGERAQVLAYADLNDDTDDMFAILYKILNVVILILVVVLTIMMGMLINIHLTQRIVEFGLLQALGYTKSQLLSKVLRENILVVVLGWAMGVAAGFGMLQAVDSALMYPNAFALNKFDLQAFIYTIPVPVSIFAVACITILQKFRRFDPVSVVERRLV